MAFWIKSGLYGGLIVGAGYALLQFTNSQEDHLVKRKKKEGRVLSIQNENENIKNNS